MRVGLWHRLVYAAARTAVFLVNLMPEGVSYAVVDRLGRVYFNLSPRRKRLALRFLRQAFPEGRSDAELLDLARRATGNVFKVALDAIRLMPVIRQGRLLDVVDARDLQRAAPRTGCLCLTPHLGSWEAGALAVCALGFGADVIVKRQRNPLVNRYLVENRRLGGMRIHPRRGGVRRLVEGIRQGRVAMLLPDQNQRLRPVIAPFFGLPARCERSAAVIALRLRCPILVAGCLRLGRGMRFRVRVFEPFVPESTGDHEADVVRTVTRINGLMEQLIREAPEQYLWIHDRFRMGKQAREAVAAVPGPPPGDSTRAAEGPSDPGRGREA